MCGHTRDFYAAAETIKQQPQLEVTQCVVTHGTASCQKMAEFDSHSLSR